MLTSLPVQEKLHFKVNDSSYRATTAYPSMTIVFLKRHPLKNEAYSNLFISKLVAGYSEV